MTATAVQFELDFDTPRPAKLTLVSHDRPTLDDVIVERWERLRAGRAAGCLVCGEPLTALGPCGACGSSLS